MKRLAIVPIVEGHGEQQSIRTLLLRLWGALGGEHVEVLQPIRRPRSKLVIQPELLKAIDLADLKLRQRQHVSEEQQSVLLLLDADDDAPCILGPHLQEIAAAERPHIDIFVVIANVEYETWFIAAAESLAGHFDLSATTISPDP
jgi:hypothetical protein